MGRPMAVVTGAARGIGRATALSLAADGFDLALGDVEAPGAVAGLSYELATPADLAETAEHCRAAGGAVLAQACDVRAAQDVHRLVAAAARAARGPLCAAVAAAGVIGRDADAWELTDEDLDLDLSVNFYGVVNLARAAVPHLLAAPPGRGRFVAVVSAAAETGLPRLGGYVAAKHAALGFVRSLAADLGPHGVTANAVLPGSTRTDLLSRTAQVYGLATIEDFARHQRLHRLLEPREVAAAVAWLCSEQASAVTGQGWGVDGGFTG